MSYQLYQFPISHYCEKVRFALAYKGLHYQTRNLVPGMHSRVTSKLGEASSVPILVDGSTVIQDSAAIISYLDEQCPQQALTPRDADRRTEAVAWEQWLDRQVGKDVRLYCYDTLLQHRPLVSGFFCSEGPWWGRVYLALGYGRLAKMMRARMDLTPENAEAALVRIGDALDRLNGVYAERKYLVGDVFTRADLAAAALFAPLFMPKEYGLKWPAQVPEPLGGVMQQLSPQLDWARRIYADHRGG